MATVGVSAGCSVADPDTSQVVLHYTGGSFSSQNFEYCVPNGQRNVGGSGDYDFYYPNGRRTWTFGEGADQEPIGINTKDVLMVGRGTVAFRVNTDCAPFTDKQGVYWPGGHFQKFHDTIGRAKVAYVEEGGVPTSDGWRSMLHDFMGGAAEKTMDAAAQPFPSATLYSDPNTVALWDKSVTDNLQTRLDAIMGDRFLIVEEVDLARPDLPGTLLAERNNLEGAKLRQGAADIDKAAAANFPGGVQGYLDYQQKQAVNEAIKNGKVQVLPIPQGSPVIVGGR